MPHLYVAGVGLQEAGLNAFLFGVLLANLLPSGVGLALLWNGRARAGLGWLIASFLASCCAVWIGLIRPTGSTSALIFLFLPAWNCLLVGPVGALLVSLTSRARR